MPHSMSTRGDTDGDRLTHQGRLKLYEDNQAEKKQNNKKRSAEMHKKGGELIQVLFYAFLLAMATSFLRSCAGGFKGGQIQEIPPFKSLDAKTNAVNEITKNDNLMEMITNKGNCSIDGAAITQVKELIATLQAPIQGQPPLNSISRKSSRRKSASRKSASRKSASRKFKSI